MNLATLTKAGAAALALSFTTPVLAHTTCDSSLSGTIHKTYYTAGYDFTPASDTVVVRSAPVVRYAPVTLVAPAVPHFRTFSPFRPGLVIVN